jgi:hypothetical protein
MSRGWSILLASSALACSMSDGVLGGFWGDGTGGDASANGSVDGGPTPAACGLASPIVKVQSQATCAGRLAAMQFSNALCSCADVRLSDYLKTRGFDSSRGPYQEGQSDDGGAAVAVNGSYSSLAGTTDVMGSFSIAGLAEMQYVGVLSVQGDFWAGGNISATGATTVSRDAWLAGNFVGLGPLTVNGNLHHAGSVIALPLTAGTNQRQTVAVPKACPCQPADLLDVGAVVDAAKLDNDNNSLGISSGAFASVSGSVQWTLPCGRAYLSQIAGLGSVEVHVTGMAAIFVDGSINLTGSLTFDLAPGAEIDVFVKQDLAVLGPLAVGSRDRPASGRLWVGGSQSINLFSPWIGNLYAPRAHVGAMVGLEVWGSIFAGDFSGGAYATFVFDRAVGAAGDRCAAPRPPAGSCTQCRGCWGGSACVSGTCGACRDDADCCSLSVCANGSCVPLMELPFD